MTRTLALLLLVLGRAVRAEEATIAFNFQDVELPVLAKFVSEVTGRNFIVDDRVHGKATIISPTRVTPDEAYVVFQSVLQVKGFATVPSGRFTKIVAARDARELAGGDEAVTTRILPLRHADAAALVPVLQPLVSKDGLITAYPATNRLVIVDSGANVERLASLLRELDLPASERRVEPVHLRFAPADELAQHLRDTLGGEGSAFRAIAEPRTNSVLLAGPAEQVGRARDLLARLDVSTPSAARVHVYRLRYAEAAGLVRVLSQLLALPPPPETEAREHGSSLMRRERRAIDDETRLASASASPPATGGNSAAMPLEAPIRITADPATNALVVSATAQDWVTLRPVIAELDVARRQVFVEAIILEATIDKTRQLGIELQGVASTGSGVGLGRVNLGPLAGAAADPTSLPALVLAAASNQQVTLPSGERVPAHSALLTALESDADVNVLSAPNVLTTDNEEAEIVVGRNVPLIASRATNQTNLANTFTTIERQDIGITLRMVPQITADDFVRLTLFEEVSDIDQTVTAAVGDPSVVGPTTTVRSASTVIAARAGQTVVIGGLLADAIRSSERRVPFLGDIPVLGALFRKTDERRVKTNLLVFLTPHIITNDQEMAAQSLRQRDRMPSPVRRSPALRGRDWPDAPAEP